MGHAAPAPERPLSWLRKLLRLRPRRRMPRLAAKLLAHGMGRTREGWR